MPYWTTVVNGVALVRSFALFSSRPLSITTAPHRSMFAPRLVHALVRASPSLPHVQRVGRAWSQRAHAYSTLAWPPLFPFAASRHGMSSGLWTSSSLHSVPARVSVHVRSSSYVPAPTTSTATELESMPPIYREAADELRTVLDVLRFVTSQLNAHEVFYGQVDISVPSHSMFVNAVLSTAKKKKSGID